MNPNRKSPNRNLWAGLGISPEGDEQCDAAMLLFLEAIRRAGTLSDLVFKEASFQLGDLLKRTSEFQDKNRWVPPADDDG